MASAAIHLIVLLLFPYLTIRLQKINQRFSPIFICYFAGILIGNLFPEILNESLIKSVYEGAVILALPMLLFSTDIRQLLSSSIRNLKAFSFALLATCIAAFVTFHFFGYSELSKAQASSLLTGVYSGGTPNMSAVHIAIDAPEELFISLNAYDIIFSLSYFAFMITIAVPLLNKILKPTNRDVVESEDIAKTDNALSNLNTRSKIVNSLISVGAAILALLPGVGISFLIHGELNPTTLILLITTAGLSFSLYKPLRTLPGTFETANYLLLVFGLALGALANFRTMLDEGTELIGYAATLFGIMVVLHLIFSRIGKIDTDLHLIASAAAIFGPPFIGPVAQGIGNRSLIAGGITIGVIGNAIGTYLGILMWWILA